MKNFRTTLIFSLLALIIGSGFAPWVYRPAVALQLTPPGLAEYVKFLHEVRFGQLAIERLYFLLPLAVMAYAVPLIAVNVHLGLHPLLAWLLRLTAIPMALSLLSPIWAPARLLEPEFILQTQVAGGALIFWLLAFIFKKLPLKLGLLLVVLLAGGGLSLALQQFYLANAAIAATYASSVWLGWGGWLAIVGAVGLTVSAVWVWFVRDWESVAAT